MGAQSGEFTEFVVEGQDLAVRPGSRRVGEGGVDEAEAGSGLSGKAVQRIQEKIGTGHKLEFFGIEQNAAGMSGGGKIEPQHQHRHDFEENILEEQSFAPLGGEKALHEGAGGLVVRVALIVKGDQETGVEYDHRGVR